MKLLTSIFFASILVSNVISKYYTNHIYVCVCVGVYCICVTSGKKTCKVGDHYQKKSSVSDIGGYWYLNVEVPAICSGSIDGTKLDIMMTV